MYILIAIWSLFLLLMGLRVTGLFPFDYVGAIYYWFTMPFLIHTIFCFILSAYCQFRPNAEIKKIVRWTMMLFPLTWFFAMVQWPGGDDGLGMAWFLFVGGPSLLTIIGLFLGQSIRKLIEQYKAIPNQDARPDR